MVVEGDTFTVMGDELPLKTVPSDNVPLQGAVPVTIRLMLMDCPLQIILPTFAKPVGRGLTVITAESL